MTQPLIRPYKIADRNQVANLWSVINLELAPANMMEQFETYIATALMDELDRLHDVFSPSRRNQFWVVEIAGEIIGTFGLESWSDDTTELRRMYLDARWRGSGLATTMLNHAEKFAASNGFRTLVLSTAEIQEAALAFYRKNDYRLVRTEVAAALTTKTVGGGLKRYHFEKDLV